MARAVLGRDLAIGLGAPFIQMLLCAPNFSFHFVLIPRTYESLKEFVVPRHPRPTYQPSVILRHPHPPRLPLPLRPALSSRLPASTYIWPRLKLSRSFNARSSPPDASPRALLACCRAHAAIILWTRLLGSTGEARSCYRQTLVWKVEARGSPDPAWVRFRRSVTLRRSPHRTRLARRLDPCFPRSTSATPLYPRSIPPATVHTRACISSM
jgi:hypothetical protein